MSPVKPDFLDALSQDLVPRPPLRDGRVALGLVAMLLVGALLVALALGVRPDLMDGSAPISVFVRLAVLAVAGGLCAMAALRMARPGVGYGRAPVLRMWRAALVVTLCAPLVTLGFLIADPVGTIRILMHPSAPWCLAVSIPAGLCFAAMMVWYLRAGAPVNPERAGLVTGLGAGALGVLVYSVHCPVDHIAYMGLWYPMVIGVVTLVCRMVVPGIIRW